MSVLQAKGEELKWDHVQLFAYFKSQINPYMKKLKKTTRNTLNFYRKLQSVDLRLTADIETLYEIFIDLYHYEQFVSHSNDLEPSVEVLLMWMTHCLNTHEYYYDSNKRFQELIDVPIHTNWTNSHSFYSYLQSKFDSPIFNKIVRKSNNNNPRYWFIRNLHIYNSIIQQINFINKINIIQSSEIENKEIYYAIHRYYKYLYLVTLYPDNIIIPTIDIDLLWHSHIVSFNDYYKCSMYIKNGIIKHNQNINDTDTENRRNTEILWNKIFGDNDYMNGRAFFIESIKDDNSNYNDKDGNGNSTTVTGMGMTLYPPQTLMNQTHTHTGSTSTNLVTPTPNTYDGEKSYLPQLEEKASKASSVNIQKIQKKNDEFLSMIEVDMDDDGSNDTSTIDDMIEFYHYANFKCIDCCVWTFRRYKYENICVMVCVSCIVSLCLALFGGYLFLLIPNTNTTIHLYQNNITINNDGTIGFDSLINCNIQNNEFQMNKSIGYAISSELSDDIIDYDGGWNEYKDWVSEPDLNSNNEDDNYYYVNMIFDLKEYDESIEGKQLYPIEMSYTLSSLYWCCMNMDCTQFALHLPWINKWKYTKMVEDIDINIFYENIYDLPMVIYSSWDTDTVIVQDTQLIEYHLSTNMKTDDILIIYFELILNNNVTRNEFPIGETQKRCNLQTKYYQQEYTYYIQNNEVISLTHFIIVSICSISMFILLCYGCWWIVYLSNTTLLCKWCDLE